MAQIKFHFYLAQICSIYGYSISGPYMGNPYATYKDIHIWPLSVPYMEFISGLYKIWADIT